MVIGSTPIFAAADVPDVIRFYTEVLGFDNSWLMDPPTFGGVNLGKAGIMFNQLEDVASRVEGHEHWFEVDDVEALYAKHLERGAMILGPPEDKPWGTREYTVRDPNGYHLRFNGKQAHVSKGSGQFPDGVVIVPRLPTAEEYQAVAGSEFPVQEGMLERTWGGVVALSPENEVIGVVRIMFDAPGWFSIWDVAVLAKWQGQRIGSAMMEAAMGLIREDSPGAFVFLFTYKHEFYARLGFELGSVTTRRV